MSSQLVWLHKTSLFLKISLSTNTSNDVGIIDLNLVYPRSTMILVRGGMSLRAMTPRPLPGTASTFQSTSSSQQSSWHLCKCSFGFWQTNILRFKVIQQCVNCEVTLKLWWLGFIKDEREIQDTTCNYVLTETQSVQKSRS